MEPRTGPIRKHWNYFKRGKNEINFLLNIYQTIIIIWAGSQIGGGFKNLVMFSVIFGVILLLVSIAIGKYSLTKVDTALAFINPFTQDVTVYRSLMAEGFRAQAVGNHEEAIKCFEDARLVLRKWVNAE